MLAIEDREGFARQFNIKNKNVKSSQSSKSLGFTYLVILNNASIYKFLVCPGNIPNRPQKYVLEMPFIGFYL